MYAFTVGTLPGTEAFSKSSPHKMKCLLKSKSSLTNSKTAMFSGPSAGQNTKRDQYCFECNDPQVFSPDGRKQPDQFGRVHYTSWYPHTAAFCFSLLQQIHEEDITLGFLKPSSTAYLFIVVLAGNATSTTNITA
jgi:hypothetical protein